MTSNRSLWWASLLWLVVIVAAVVGLGDQVWRIHLSAARQIETLEPRMARLAGLGADRARLQQAAVQAAQAVERHAYPSTRDASQAGNDAQQRVRDLFSRSGLEVVSLQVLPARGAGQFDRIPIAVRVEGELAALQATLAAAPSLSPSVFVEGFALQGANTSEASPPRVVAELQMFVLRVRP
jgi:general secretion pathway protein M